MKTVFAKTLAELKKPYTTLTVVLFFIAAISSFFTKFEIVESNTFLVVIKMLYILSSGFGLTAVLIPFLVYLDEYFETTRLSKFSIASLFSKNANHSTVNLKTLIVLISAVYAVIAVMTGLVFVAAIIFWLITCLALMFE